MISDKSTSEAEQVFHDSCSVTQTKAHPKLFVGTGNVFSSGKFSADGIAAFVKYGFSGTYTDYSIFKEQKHTNIKVYEYIYPKNKHLPYGKEVSSIVSKALDYLSEQGCKVITMPSIRTEDCDYKTNDDLIVDACKNWLEEHENIEKVIIVDKLGQLEKRCY